MTECDDQSQTVAEPWAWTRIKQRKAINVIETRGCLRWPEIDSLHYLIFRKP